MPDENHRTKIQKNVSVLLGADDEWSLQSLLTTLRGNLLGEAVGSCGVRPDVLKKAWHLGRRIVAWHVALVNLWADAVRFH